MNEFKIEMPKIPESDWSKVLEAVSKETFFINTSTPKGLLEKDPGGVRTFEYKKNESNGKYDDENKGVNEALKFYYDNKEVFKNVPEVVVFTPDNKLIYTVNPDDALKELSKTAFASKPIYELPEEVQVLWRMANWSDIHSYPPRAGNNIRLVIDLELNLRSRLEDSISKDPVKVRQLLEKIAKERMYLDDYWREWNPDTLRLQDFPTQAVSWKETPGSSIRPPWEFWKKLGLNKIYVQHSDSTKEKPHIEYRNMA